MNKNIKQYEEYREAKQSWLKKIPVHWREAKSKRLFLETSVKNHPHEELLSATQSQGVIPRSMLKTRVVMPTGNLETFKLVKEGNYVISLRSFQGGLEYSKYRGIVSPAYNILEERTNQSRDYYKYLFKSHDFIGELQRNVTGIRQGKNIDVNDFKEIMLPIPPMEEQIKIVKYLDNQLLKINKFIKAKKKLITVLKEQKQAVIDEAMTKGLNTDVNMKYSDIEWLEDIPEHWEYNKIKRFAKISPSKSKKFKQYSLEDEVVFLPMDKISNYGDIDNTERRPIYTVKEGFTYFEKNDVVVAKITPCFENGKGACLDNLDTQIGFGTTELVVLRANEKMLPKYLYFITRTSYFRKFGEELMTGAAGQKRVPSDFISNFSIGVPDTNEQSTIIEHIYSKIEKIDNSITVTQKQIDLILEYRTSLISDVVTGKVNVQNIEVNYSKENYLNIEDIEEDTIELEEVLEGEECED
ncbi:restriction endonuclease subunit S [Peribacillus simplex]